MNKFQIKRNTYYIKIRLHYYILSNRNNLFITYLHIISEQKIQKIL